ncbi:MAG TPA: 7TM diverse intracellular signaling domain-containing protein [Leptospiraceae bacterium]|nr:7TM diverse intracellular signaling domain-containing protein [Leptospiraceae bacterium]HMY67783.1 7TM diverse intracellular signaling domain-containing protein [Leptospiraceae bacterium]HNF12326.1 7TM diverse intracellular signaling domain-containing protein [Leptospiraceae bacterium]HNM01572.1 7TM diverse intracellular signaling domain-containing protein [Leptospiraceae bacterium]HNN03619.1 7TM diverse intracellular signaling domain-containing protein [Leptospiraceae bacterium]
MKFSVSVLLLVGLHLPVFAERTVRLSENTRKAEIGKKMNFLYQEGKDLNFTEIFSPEIQKQFIPSVDTILQLGFKKDPVWIGFKVFEESEKQRDWVLSISFPILDHIEIYTQEGTEYKKRTAGDSYPFYSREINHRNFIIPMNFAPGKETSVWLKIHSSSSITVPLTLYTKDELRTDGMLTEGWHFLFYGVLTVMIIYNAFICIAFRSLTYLLYSLSTLLFLVYYLCFNGHGFQYLWPDSPKFQNYAVPVFVHFSWIFTAEFTLRFLHLKELSPALHRTVRMMEVITSLSLLALFHSIMTALILQSIFGAPSVLLLLFCGFKSWKRGNKSARFFVMAWGVFFCGVFMVLLRSLGFLGMNLVTHYTMQAGTMIELVFLSLALADRYKFIQEENVRVQKTLLETQIRHTETLEEKVLQRTEELKSTLATIRQDLSLAGKIQQGLLNIHYSIMTKMDIVPLYIPISEVGGDYYSINRLDEWRFRFFLADATGHGVQAALITMAVKGIYDNIREFHLGTADILSIFNNEFTDKYSYLNALLTCIIIDIDLQNQRITYASAGHPAAVIVRKNSKDLLEKTGSMVGLTKNVKFASKELEFTASDKIYAFTDGAFEQFNSSEEEFGEERLYAILMEYRTMSIEDTVRAVRKNLYSFLGERERQDDITVIGIGYNKV